MCVLMQPFVYYTGMTTNKRTLLIAVLLLVGFFRIATLTNGEVFLYFETPVIAHIYVSLPVVSHIFTFAFSFD